MQQSFVIAIAGFALVSSILTLGFGLYFNVAARGIRHMVDVVGGLASGFLWFVAAFGASGMERTTSCCVVSTPAPGAAMLFGGFGVLMVVIALLGTAVLMDTTDLAGDDNIM